MDDNDLKFWRAFVICAVLLILGIVAATTVDDIYEMGHVKPEVIQRYVWPKAQGN